MKFSKQEIQEIINGNPVGVEWPWMGGSAEDIEQHLRGVVAELDAIDGISLDADFDSYGSGYASYVHVFCFLDGQEATYERDGRTWTDGLAIYLNRLAPVAAWGPETRSQFERGWSHGFLESSMVDQFPEGQLESHADQITAILQQAGLELLTTAEATEPLPFSVDIRTNFDNRTLFDALFYWED